MAERHTRVLAKLTEAVLLVFLHAAKNQKNGFFSEKVWKVQHKVSKAQEYFIENEAAKQSLCSSPSIWC